MKPLSSREIRGNWATLLASWNADESLDLGRIAVEIDLLIAAGVDGIYCNGTAGEFHAQTEEEFATIGKLLADKCESAGMPFQIGASHTSAIISRQRVRLATFLRPSAIQVILPDWFPVTIDEAIVFLQRIADDSAGVGLVLYNPPHSKVVLSVDELARLAHEVPQLVGIKVAGGDAEWYTKMQPLFERLSVFVAGHTLATGISQGAHGAYSNVACLNPAAAQRWYDQMLNNLPAALEVEERIRRFMRESIEPFITEQRFCNAACDRLLTQVGGWCDIGPNMRWPYRSIPSSVVPALREMAQRTIPEFIVQQP
ncbi:dihydrodipicolinate synthase family protein [Aeoliella mucimassa]|uniref:N-acetylneuraminate lyase n=1 Tax=Aeoliella mucimassa TaxID=2527972 RepID=A0A518AMU2_9BACT|nr:dihydrodipicolinate synthase family protein [Aeoliella mucimassa]QDU56026.1 N-acetylneuraminate lyase [Aeoliella mucimassa]